MKKNVKLTPALLKRIIFEERKKMLETLEQGKEDSEKVKAEEVEADEFADTLEKDIDFMVALKIKENTLNKGIEKLQTSKRKVRSAMQKTQKRILERK